MDPSRLGPSRALTVAVPQGSRTVMDSNFCENVQRPGQARCGRRVGRAVSPRQEEMITTWPVPAQAGQGRDRGSAVGVTMV